MALFLLPETKYDRDLSDYQETVPESSVEETEDLVKPNLVICKEKPPLDYVNYSPRTWRSDMRLWIGTPEWYKAVDVLKV
jgi:hypothetical protein